MALLPRRRRRELLECAHSGLDHRVRCRAWACVLIAIRR